MISEYRDAGARRSSRWAMAFGALVLTALCCSAQAPARREPRIGFVYPAGGQQGTTFTVAIGGQGLDEKATAWFSPAGITASVVGYDRPLSQKEYNEAQEKMRELQEKRAAARSGAKGNGGPRVVWSDEDERKVADLRVQLTKRANRIATPAVGETVTLSVTVPADTPPGGYELRLRTPAGLSNPLFFQVGDLPEFTDPAVTATTIPPRNPGAPQAKKQAPRAPGKKPVRTVALPATVNGQILPGEADRIRFSAQKGRRLIVAASARALIPYLADAVPGWFQATLALYGPDGRELAYNDDFAFSPDPVLFCEIPADGEYEVEIKDAIYRGREDFVYRIAIGELPFITSLYPLGAPCGEAARFELRGWNLPQEELTLATRDRSPGIFVLSARNDRHLSNPVKFALGTLPELLESEPNDQPGSAHTLPPPLIANGRIGHAGDTDWYRFEGRAGDEVVIEVTARRLNSPLDSVIQLMDSAGNTIAANDDTEDRAAGLQTHHADSRLQVKLPGAGGYLVRIADAQQRGGPEYGYRLRVGPPQPDFVLRVTPASINVRGGACVPITVHAVRRDGFDGAIALDLVRAPTGFALSGGRIPAGANQVTLTLAAPSTPRPQPFSIALRGTADIGGRRVAHTATPSDDQMQAFFYRHLVPASELMVAVTGRGAMARVQMKEELRIPSGGSSRVQIASPVLAQAKEVQIELVDPPAGVSITGTTARSGAVHVDISCDAAKVKPGMEGNLLLAATGLRPGSSKQKAGKNPARVPLATIPAIPFRITGTGQGE